MLKLQPLNKRKFFVPRNERGLNCKYAFLLKNMKRTSVLCLAAVASATAFAPATLDVSSIVATKQARIGCTAVKMARSVDSSIEAPPGRREILSASMLAAAGQLVAMSLLRPSRSYEKPAEWWAAGLQGRRGQALRTAKDSGAEDLSELEIYNFQQRLKKVADNSGSGDMEKIADAMGLSFNCPDDELCDKSVFDGSVGYE